MFFRCATAINFLYTSHMQLCCCTTRHGGAAETPTICMMLRWLGHRTLFLFVICGSRAIAAEEAVTKPGQPLFECFPDASIEIPPCNAKYISEVYTRPSLPQVPDVHKPATRNKKQSFPIILTAQKQSVNIFRDHYLHVRPKLQLSENVSLPSTYDPQSTEIWTFNGQAPGPTIRATVGDVLDIQLRNLLPVATGLYFHGIFNAKDPIDGGFVRSEETKRYSRSTK